MNDYNAFDDFINGLDLPEPSGGEPSTPPPDDAGDQPTELFKRIRAMVHAILARTGDQGPEQWSTRLNSVQLFVRNEILNNLEPKPGALDHMTREEVAMNSGYHLITLAWLIYDEIWTELWTPGDESEIPF